MTIRKKYSKDWKFLGIVVFQKLAMIVISNVKFGVHWLGGGCASAFRQLLHVCRQNARGLVVSWKYWHFNAQNDQLGRTVLIVLVEHVLGQEVGGNSYHLRVVASPVPAISK